MSRLFKTLSDLKILNTRNIKFVLTRVNPSLLKEPDDLDILVKRDNFEQFIKILGSLGYESLSHDKALGGRVRGAQVNLIKPGRIKIDLHKDFTWRATRYLDKELVWKNLARKDIENIKIDVPVDDMDAFLVLINVIFEKTYFSKQDWGKVYKVMDRVFENDVYEKQAIKYGWLGSFKKFKKWWTKDAADNVFPKFLPFGLVLSSYLEKFDVVSLSYYLFFRARYLVNKTLPYD